VPIPLGYGRLRVGSTVISASLRNQQLYEFEGYQGKVQKIGSIGIPEVGIGIEKDQN